MASAVGQATVNVVRPQWSAVDETGVCLHERRSGLDTGPGVVSGLDPADRHEDQAITYPAVRPAQHGKGAVLERGTGETARADRLDLRGVGG